MQFRKNVTSVSFRNRSWSPCCVDKTRSPHPRIQNLLWKALFLCGLLILPVSFFARASSKPNVSVDANALIGTESINQKPIRFNIVPTRDATIRKYVAVYETNNSTVFFADWIKRMSSKREEGPGEVAWYLTQILKEIPFEAFRFETPGVSPEKVFQMPFEFVVVEDTSLVTFASTPDPNPFFEFLSSQECVPSTIAQKLGHELQQLGAGCVFQNLGGDATLVAPKDWSAHGSVLAISSCYGHLANFLRFAPEGQIMGMWRLVAEALEERLMSSRTDDDEEGRKHPLWFSTAGGGVAWLHFRLDNRPKYYRYRPYREFRETT